MKPGEKVRFCEDREMRGRFVDVRVTGVEPIDLSRCSPERPEAWSQAEGWSPESGRGYGKKFGAGVQIRYEPIPGQEILAEPHRDDDRQLPQPESPRVWTECGRPRKTRRSPQPYKNKK